MNALNGYDFEDLQPGMRASFAKTITEADLTVFADDSGDRNAIHLDETFARTTPFKGRIAHGMLTAGVISAAIADQRPGPGTIYLGQNLRFRAPVRPGDSVEATVTVVEISAEKRQVTLTTVCTVGSKVVTDGGCTGDANVAPASLTKRCVQAAGHAASHSACSSGRR